MNFFEFLIVRRIEKKKFFFFDFREVLNATVSTETEQVQSCSESSPYVCRTAPLRDRQRASWNTSLPVLAAPSQERRELIKFLSLKGLKFFSTLLKICFK